MSVDTMAHGSSTTAAVDIAPRQTKPVNVFAVLGALVVVFEAWVLIRWISGPLFTTVPKGPTTVPTWMHVELIAWQVVSLPAALALIYWFVIRPWRRSRHVGVDGLLVIAFMTLWWQDPISAVGGHWFTYNSDMINRGSWVNSIPGWLSFGKPGQMVQEPLLFTPAAYVYVFVIAMFLGSWIMRRAHARWPRMGKLGLIGTCFAAMLLFDVVLEGIVWLPLGVFEYPGGGPWSLFADTYHKYPINEMVTIGTTFTAVAAIRYFVNDRGQSIAERGIDDVRGPANSGRKLVVRALATIFVVQAAMFVSYNLPNAWVGLHSQSWPADLQKRSYLTDYICGAGTDRACPGPAVPNTRVGGAYVAPGGSLVVPDGVRVPDVVPFGR
jgi:hypothetical protein